MQPDLFKADKPRGDQRDIRSRCVLMDPPWMESGGGKCKRGADRHYPLIPTKKMPSVILGSGRWNIARDAHLWMWVTNNFFGAGYWLMKELGFRYVTNVAWIKVRDIAVGKTEIGKEFGTDAPVSKVAQQALQIGLGQYMRQAHELLLFGVRGDAMMPDKGQLPLSVIVAPRRQHSRKPDEQYDLIEAVSPCPRIEFFARRAWPGWEHFGNALCPECGAPLKAITDPVCNKCGHEIIDSTMEAQDG